MTKNFELLTFEELLNLPIDIESCFDPIFEPPATSLRNGAESGNRRTRFPVL